MHYFNQYYFSKADQAKALEQQAYVAKASEAADLIGECFSKSIRDSIAQYHGNKVGILLSGGVDSSLLLAMIKKFTNKEIICFTGLTSLKDPDSYPSQQLCRKFECKWVPCIIDKKRLQSRLKVILPLTQGGLYTTAANLLLDLCMEKARNEGVDWLWGGNGLDMFFGGGLNKTQFINDETTYHESFWEYSFELLVNRFYKQSTTQMDILTSIHGVHVQMPFENIEAILVARSIPATLLFRGKKDKYPVRILARHYGVPRRLINRAKSPLQQSSGVFKLMRDYMYSSLPALVYDNTNFQLTKEYFENNPNTDLQTFLSLMYEKAKA